MNQHLNPDWKPLTDEQVAQARAIILEGDHDRETKHAALDLLIQDACNSSIWLILKSEGLLNPLS